jgi:hypothetical protein
VVSWARQRVAFVGDEYANIRAEKPDLIFLRSKPVGYLLFADDPAVFFIDAKEKSKKRLSLTWNQRDFFNLYFLRLSYQVRLISHYYQK